MEKVKVSRYKPGKRPDYAPSSSSEDEEHPNQDEKVEEEEEAVDVPQPLLEYSAAEVVVSDKRLQRLQERARMQQEDEDNHAGERSV